MRKQTWWWTAGAALCAAALAAPAGAGTLYKWTAADGSVAYTDDPKRVPERYQGQAETLESGSLSRYERYTPADEPEPSARLEALNARIDRLRELNERAEVQALPAAAAIAAGLVPPPGGVYEASVEVGGATIRVPTQATDTAPVVVEPIRAIKKGKNVTQQATVVRRGDEVLMIVYPEPSLQWSPSDWVREDELLDD